MGVNFNEEKTGSMSVGEILLGVFLCILGVLITLLGLYTLFLGRNIFMVVGIIATGLISFTSGFLFFKKKFYLD